MNESIEISWASDARDRWQASQAQGRTPHALMLTGAGGTGKRNTAAFIASEHLGMAAGLALPVHPLTIPVHPDLRWIEPPPDKHTIGIDRIRELVGELSLTSYEGGGKVAVIAPADSMTHNAANSLLKTLEEPPGDTLLILVVDRAGRLPATIVSRCQRLHLRTPPQSEGLSWLQRVHTGTYLPRLLDEAGGAPLAALAAVERLDETSALALDFKALATDGAPPLPVAARWAKLDPEFVLTWLGRQVQQCITTAAVGSSASRQSVLAESVLSRIDTRNLFCYLDIINKLRGQSPGSYNVQLTLESLLIDWSEGLASMADGDSYP